MNEANSMKDMMLSAWKTGTAGRRLSPLMTSIGEAFQKASGSVVESRERYRADDAMRAVAARIASGTKRGGLACLNYHADCRGEWVVTNADLEIWSRVRMWMGRYCGNDLDDIMSSVPHALRLKRLWQAYERYNQTGLTREHCILLQKLLWDMDTSRSDWVSIHVQGKRPFGNSCIETDIYAHLGWPMPWLDSDDGPTAEQQEKAWDIFDELIFAAPDAAKLAEQSLGKQKAES